MNPYDEAVEEYVWKHSRCIDPMLEELRKETYSRTSMPQMQVGKVEGMFLRFLVALSRPKRIVEVGTFTGYSALMMASALPDDGILETLDWDEYHLSIAQKYFSRASYGGKIKPILGDARKTMPRLEGPVDLVFIDADKTSYDLYYEEAMRLLRPGGLIVLDNMLWSGRVLDPEDDSSRAIAELNEKIASDKRVENVLLTIRAGVMLARKL